MMKRKAETLVALVLMSVLTACDRSGGRAFNADRSDKSYRSAMADFSAGRLEEARKGLAGAVELNPLNASARFQLACLLQDKAQEYLAAYIEFIDYLRLEPNSDKAGIAKARAARCLEAYQLSLAGKTGSGGEIMKTIENLERTVSELRVKNVGLDRDLAEARKVIDDVSRENSRLRTLLNGIATDREAPRKNITREAELFGSDDEESKRDILSEASDIARISKSEDAVNGESSSLLPKQSADAKAKRDAKKQAESEQKAEARKSAIPHPDTYKIAEGDTLYKLALQFYGRRSAWTMIRDANKEKISNDGKLRVGDVIKLP